MLPDADAEQERTATTTGGISFLKLLKVNYQPNRRGLLIPCGLPYSLNDKQAGRNNIYEESVSHLLALGLCTAPFIWEFSVAVKKGL